MKFCPSCGAKLATGARFCHQCGHPLTPPLAPQDADGRDKPSADIGQNAILRETGHNETVGGSVAHLEERKEVTVLFADIANSTAIISEHDPEDVVAFLDGVTSRMVDAVQRYGGTVNQVMGDGIMALFGAPVAVEDHAAHACLAALDVKALLAEARQAGMGKSIGDVQLRIGISTGEVVVRSVALRSRFDFSALGATTHLSARLEQLAEPNMIYCSSQTQKLAGSRFKWRPLGWTRVRGFLSPVEVHELLGMEADVGRFDRLTASNLSPFVGREVLVARLRGYFDAEENVSPKIAAIVGDAGIGKSRLCLEIIENKLADGWQCQKLETDSYGRDIAYLPFKNMLRRYFGLHSNDSDAEFYAKIRVGLKILDAAFVSCLPAVLSIFGKHIEDPVWAQLDAQQRQHQTFDTISRLLNAESQRTPMVILVEDVQWLDDDSEALLRHIVTHAQGKTIAFLLTSRARQECTALDLPAIELVELAPLSNDNANHLFEQLCGNDQSLSVLRRNLIEKAEGNPFFIEESIKALVNTGSLIGSPGKRRLSHFDGEIEIPGSVRTVIASRVDRLKRLDKTVLRAASVIGNAFSLQVLDWILAERSKEDLLASLGRLVDSGLVRAESTGDEHRYRFSHGITHDVVYRDLLRDRKIALHARILDSLEVVYADRIEDYTETLAHHSKSAEIWDKAIRYSWASGRRASNRSSYRAAVNYLDSSLSFFENLPDNRQNLDSVIDISFDLRNALYPLGEIQRDLDNLQRISRNARNRADPVRLAWLSAYTSRDLALLGRPDEAITSGQRALALARAAGVAELEILTTAYIALAHYALGNFKESAGLLGDCIERVRDGYEDHNFGLPAPGYLFFQSWRLWALARLGAFDEGKRYADDLFDYIKSLEHPLIAAVAHYSAGFLHLHCGDLDRALALLGKGLRICNEWDLVAWFTNLSSALGRAEVMAGNPEIGRAHIQAATQRSQKLGIMVSHALEMAWLGEAEVACHEPDRARATLRQALELSEKYREWGNKAEVLVRLGEFHASQQPENGGDARALFQEGLSLAEACQMAPLAARSRIGMEKLARI